MMKSVNLYDFDHTIYKGDASIDFIVYCLVRNPRLWKYLPSQGFVLIRYVFGLTDRKAMKQVAFSFLQDVKDVDAVLTAFWSKHERKIAAWYGEKHQNGDIIISASPEFLLQPITSKLNVGALIATKMNKSTGKIRGENCRGEEKVKRLKSYDADLGIGYCYSDSLSDMPILTLAKHPYVVKGEVLVRLRDHKPSKFQNFKKLAFLRFLFVGGLNAFLGVLFSSLALLVMPIPVAAFVVGYTLSLIASYFLNAIVTFQSFNFSFGQFVRFVISYIPNFIIQFICVYLFVDILNVYPVFAYIFSVVIAVPITFLLLSNHTFKGGSKK